MDYYDKKQARVDRYLARADKAQAEADQRYKQDRHVSEQLNGQPILVGHHSEKRHRGLINRMWENKRKEIQANKKAEHYREKAQAAANSTAISSDAPDAIELLREKLAKMEATQERYKAINKIVRRAPKNQETPEKLRDLDALDIGERVAKKLFVEDYGRFGIPSYELTNNNANMRRVRERIAEQEARAEMEHVEESINGCTVELNPDDNRVRIYFPGKPDPDLRSDLKRQGFKWAPSVGAWQRYPSNWAFDTAKKFAERYAA